MSSPLYPKANGKAEKGVQIVKRLLKKAAASNSDEYLALLNYRSSPLGCGLSPAELLMNRKLCDTLPKLSFKRENKSLTLKEMQHQKRKQKEFYDKGSRQLIPLSEQDVVRIEEPTEWRKKAVVLKEVNPRSYLVQTEYGQVLRRNRRSLLKSAEVCKSNIELSPLDVLTSHEEMPSGAESPSEVQLSEQSPELVSSAPETDSPILRRSNRVRKPPVRLDL
uniref:Integrase catalytic domain-containing protein n=1 Tax=Cyprinus carpio carpio TaxID=630221 RepID=A0A9J7ZGX9_CYPCA